MSVCVPQQGGSVICRDSVSLIPWFLGYVFRVFPRVPPEEVRQRRTLGGLGWYKPPYLSRYRTALVSHPGRYAKWGRMMG